MKVLVTGGGRIDSSILNYKYHVEGKTLREVAQDFGISTTPIRQRLIHERYPTIEIVMVNSDKELLEGIAGLLHKVNVSSRLRKNTQFGGFGKKRGLGERIYTLVILGSSEDRVHFIKN